jgi:predicted nuclease of predicted toxin-antitoxin system
VRYETGLLVPVIAGFWIMQAAHDFILVSTDSDFERLLSQIPGAKVVILRSCDYPTGVAAEVLRRNAIRIAELPGSQDRLIILDQ